ncbi:MAG: Hvo_1808 family surface protein [Halobacteriaceae archaeon]
MRARSVVAVVVLAVVASATVAAATVAPSPNAVRTDQPGTGGGAGSVDPTSTRVAAPPDPSSDVLGWENGRWYNESIVVDQSDGLNETERDTVVARSMARIEFIRRLEFEQTVPVTVISRATYREQLAGGFANVSTSVALHQNVKFEALFMIGENESALASQQSTRSASVLGFYSPSTNQIIIVSENTTSPKIDEITLSQELFHALQDQKFDIFGQRTPTREEHNALDGIIEGDGNYVDYLYEQRCENAWSCLIPNASSGGGGDPSQIHFGILYLQFLPYSDGPPFVRQIREAGGWEAVNAIYENPPASTEQLIHPDKYGVDPPTEVTVEDTSTERWTIPETGGVRYASFGEAGLFTMLLYPSITAESTDVIISLRDFYNFGEDGELQAIDPLNYRSRYSAGWDGDRLYPYVTEDSARTNETGYVWKSVWDSESDAAEFIEGYTQLLAFHGGEQQEPGLWVIPDGPYADAFYIDQRGDTVLIVNAPTVPELAEIRPTADIPQVQTTTATTMGTVDSTTSTSTQATTMANGTTTSTSTAFGPGFGPVVALLVAVVTVLGLRAIKE